MVVVGVTDDPKGKAQSYMSANGIKYDIGLVRKRVYSDGGIPAAWVISPAGKVVFKGHPSSVSDGLIEKQLETAFVTPKIDFSGMKAEEKLFKKQKYGSILNKLEERANSGEDTAAKTAYDQIEAFAKAHFKLIETFKENGDYSSGLQFLSKTEKAFKGSKYGDQAKTMRSEWKKDKTISTELKASGLLAKAKDLQKRNKLKKAKGILQALVNSKKYRETKAAEEAKTILNRMP